MMRLTILALSVVTLFSGSMAEAHPNLLASPRVAVAQPVTDTYGNTSLTDPYRWMEAKPKPAFGAFLHSQDDFARAVIARLPGRAALGQEIAAIDRLDVLVSGLTLANGSYFYLKRPAGAELSRLYVRDGTGERVLVDPARLGDSIHHVEIDQFAPSQDGSRVAYGTSEGGSEQSVLHIMETASGKLLVDTIDRAQFAAVSWAPDGDSFFYARLPADYVTASPDQRYSHLRVLRHVLGTNPDQDATVLNSDALPFAFKATQVVPSVVITPGSDYALALVHDGVSLETAVYSVPLSGLAAPHVAWQQAAAQADCVTEVTLRNDTLTLLSHAEAPRFRVLQEDLAHPGFANAREVLSQADGVTTAVAAASDGLYVARREGAVFRLLRLADNASATQTVILPFKGTIPTSETSAGGLVTDPRRPGALVELSSWFHPDIWLRFVPDKVTPEESATVSGTMQKTGIAPIFPQDLSGYEALETSVRAEDGTMIPLSVLTKKGLILDGRRPLLIDGYGSYGIAMDPDFLPTMIPWLDRGGVFAEAHVRGGGELGAAWHEAGRLATKQTSITDFLDCARWLVAQHYTNSAHLAGQGTSAGGIVIAGAITEDPALFRAALIRVGATNATRQEFSENGPSNIPEFGSVTNPAQLPALLAMDAYQHVRDHTAYPAVLLTGGADDPRVPVWEPAKMAARLQSATSSGRPILLRIEFDAGHGFGSTLSQRDAETSDELAFLLWQFGDRDFQPRS